MAWCLDKHRDNFTFYLYAVTHSGVGKWFKKFRQTMFWSS